MAAITSIPDIYSVVREDYKAFRIQAGAAITRGTVLGIDSNGRCVPYPITGTPKAPIGVALESGAIYDYITCVYDGVVNVANADDTTAIAIGALVKVGTFAGAVIAGTIGTDTAIIGQVLSTAIAGGSYGAILLKLH